VISSLAEQRIPVGVLVAPIIPALNDTRFGTRGRGPELSTAAFRWPGGDQMGLFTEES